MKVTQLLGSLAAFLLCLACGDNRIEKGPIKRSGQADVVSLDDDWRFIRMVCRQMERVWKNLPGCLSQQRMIRTGKPWMSLMILLLKDRSGWTWREIRVAFRFRESVGIEKPLQ